MSVFSDLQKRFGGQLTPRVAYGLVALLAIGLFLLVTDLSDRADTMAASVTNMKAELKMLKDDSSATVWSDRAKLTAKTKAAWEEIDWTAETPGIASAEIQAALTGIVTQAGFLDARVQVSGDPVELNGRRVLRFEIAGIAQPGSLLKGIVGVTTAKKRLVISEITTGFSQDGQPGPLTLIGHGSYRATTPPADKAGAQQARNGAPSATPNAAGAPR